MKLYGVTTTYNNEDIVPFVMKYTEALGYDKLIVYDNESTDRTVELLSKYPFIEIREWNTGGIFDDTMKTELINNFVRTETNLIDNETDFTWVTVSDFDEVFYFNNDAPFKDYLRNLTYCGINVCSENILNLLVAETGEGIDTNEFLHENENSVVSYNVPFGWQKPSLFRVDNLKYYETTLGEHFSYFDYGENKIRQFYNTKYISRFHLKYCFKDYYKKMRTCLNQRKYTFSGKEFDSYVDNEEIGKLESTWNKKYKSGISTKTYLENKLLNGDDSHEHGEQLTRFGNFIWGNWNE